LETWVFQTNKRNGHGCREVTRLRPGALLAQTFDAVEWAKGLNVTVNGVVRQTRVSFDTKLWPNVPRKWKQQE
jgi:hypothetical protein